MKKLKLLVIMTSCVLLTGAISPGNLFAEIAIEEWVARYNGPDNFTDGATAIAVDASGNLYVTGYCYSSTYWDYATVKYDSSGNELWVARYNGPANSADSAYSMALDASGNVYVTGLSFGSGTSTDYATVKYDTDGNELWVARYNGPANSRNKAQAMALDASGNVYVTGYSIGRDNFSGYDYATVKYDSSGNELWVARYNGPANYFTDWPCAMALDASGSVYVTGLSHGSGTSPDYATVKYDTDGKELWVARYNGPANSRDNAQAMALDASGSVYVTGCSYGSGTYDDYATVKYDSSGNELWVARYNGPANSADSAYSMALDASGNVYVTGRSFGSGTSTDYATVKYDSSGNELWVARYNGPANSADSAYSMALDASGNVYVTGRSFGSGTSTDYATVKYDSSGNELWVARYNGPASSGDYANAMALDASGNVYVTGRSFGSGTSLDYATIKYSQVTPVGAIQQLIIEVIGLNLQQWIENGLDAKLDAALKAIDDINANNDVAAINTIDAFINAVQAQRGNKITEADADALIAVAQEIIDILSGT